jgi:hypothetical protein
MFRVAMNMCWKRIHRLWKDNHTLSFTLKKKVETRKPYRHNGKLGQVTPTPRSLKLSSKVTTSSWKVCTCPQRHFAASKEQLMMREKQTRIKDLRMIQNKSRLPQLHDDGDVVRMQENAALAKIAWTREKVGEK